MSKLVVADCFVLLFCLLTTMSVCSYSTIVKQFDVQPLSNDEDSVSTLRTEIDDGLECIYPTDCRDVKECGRDKSGVYRVFPLGVGDGFLAYCDMKSQDGGWLVFQRRQDGREDFYRNWTNYTVGFGNLLGEFWLGLEKLHLLTSQRHYELLVNLGRYGEGSRHAMYDRFYISDEGLQFQLHLGSYSGNAGDSLKYHNGNKFSTFDKDNDNEPTSSCATNYQGGWWYNGCHYANLNGPYFTTTQKSEEYVNFASWYHWTNSYKALQFIELKLRPYL